MRLLRAADHRWMPWKNGGGATLEVAISPADAGIAAFDWRISMAVVAADGAFSAFPGADRTLTLLDGEGMTLAVAGESPILLTPDSAPCVFPGDVATTATLVGGPITDLNVMTARGRYTHVVARSTAPRALHAGPHETLLILGDGVAVEAAAESVTLGLRDFAMLESGETAYVCPAPITTWLLVTIRPVD